MARKSSAVKKVRPAKDRAAAWLQEETEKRFVQAARESLIEAIEQKLREREQIRSAIVPRECN